MSVKVEIRGLERIMRKLGPGLIDKPLRRFFKRAATEVNSRARDRAPVDTGVMRASLREEIDRGRPPLWAKVGTNVTHKGVSYPRVLEESPIHHYRGTQFAGQPTKGWFSGSVKKAMGAIRGFVRRLGEEIGDEWG